MDVKLNKEQKMIQSSAKEFLKAEFPMDMVRELEEREEGYSPKQWQKLAELGWLGLNIPEAYDGMGMNYLDLTLLLEAKGYNLLPGPFFSTVIAAFPIILSGSEEQKREYLPKIADGKLKMSLALAEPSGTFDPKGIEMEAVAQGDTFIINGTKLFVEHAQSVDYLITAARTDPGAKGEGGLSLFIIDAQTPGIKISHIPTIGLDRQYEVQFVDVRIPRTNLVGPENQGWIILSDTLQRAQVGKGAEMLGGMQAAMDLTNAHVKKRETYGKAVASYQVIQHYLANVWIDVETTRNLVYLAAWKISEGLACIKEASAAKAFGGKAFSRVTERCLQMHGAVGLTREYDIGLYYRDARACELAFGDGHYQREVIAGEIF